MMRREQTKTLKQGRKVIQSLIVVPYELKIDERSGEVVHGKVESSAESQRGEA